MDLKYKLLLIIGNGFDLDLNLKTSYKSFVESTEFKEHLKDGEVESLIRDTQDFIYKDFVQRSQFLYKQGTKSIFPMLAAKTSLQNWIDIEQQLALIAHNRKNIGYAIHNGVELLDLLPIEKKSFYELHSCLKNYLDGLPYEQISKGSSAYRLFSILNQYPEFVHVKSFNYTVWDKIFKNKTQIIPEHIHGRLDDSSLIIGIQDNIDIAPEYNYMIKTFSENFRSHDLIPELRSADEVIFFGHSFGETDYHYFEDFFKRQTNPDTARIGLPLSIFTLNRDTRMNILEQLRVMNNKRTDYLYALSNLNIFMTDPKCNNINEIENFLRVLDFRLKKESYKVQYS